MKNNDVFVLDNKAQDAVRELVGSGGEDRLQKYLENVWFGDEQGNLEFTFSSTTYNAFWLLLGSEAYSPEEAPDEWTLILNNVSNFAIQDVASQLFNEHLRHLVINTNYFSHLNLDVICNPIYDSYLETIVLNCETLVQLSGTRSINSDITPVVYVPANLLTQYQSDALWTVMVSQGYCTLEAISE